MANNEAIDIDTEPIDQKINKYKMEMEGIEKLMCLFYWYNSEQTLGFVKESGKEFIYTEGASVFEEQLNESDIFEFGDQKNIIELYLDGFHFLNSSN